jgi:hypothetical protein
MQVILNINDNKAKAFLNFIKTLDFVTIEEDLVVPKNQQSRDVQILKSKIKDKSSQATNQIIIYNNTSKFTSVGVIRKLVLSNSIKFDLDKTSISFLELTKKNKQAYDFLCEKVKKTSNNQVTLMNFFKALKEIIDLGQYDLAKNKLDISPLETLKGEKFKDFNKSNSVWTSANNTKRLN